MFHLPSESLSQGPSGISISTLSRTESDVVAEDEDDVMVETGAEIVEPDEVVVIVVTDEFKQCDVVWGDATAE